MAASRRSTRSLVKITSLVGEFAPTMVVDQPPPVARRFADDQTAAISHVSDISPLYTDLESASEFQNSRISHQNVVPKLLIILGRFGYIKLILKFIQIHCESRTIGCYVNQGFALNLVDSHISTHRVA